MSLYFITGGSATGKSALSLEVRNRGYNTYDTDDDALARWQNIETGYIHPKSSVKPADRTAEFLQTHLWNVPREFVEDIAKENKVSTAFICGVANNMDQIRDLFSGIFALTVDEETLRHRIANRTNNDWGKQPHELAQILEAHRTTLDTYTRLGYMTIDATRPIETVADEILAYTYQ